MLYKTLVFNSASQDKFIVFGGQLTFFLAPYLWLTKKNYVIDDNVDDTSNVVLHHYVNKQTGYTHTSIYDNDIRIINEGYEQVD